MRLILIILSLTLSLSTMVKADSCSPSNYKSCSDKMLCDVASTINNGNFVWKKHSDLVKKIVSPRLQKTDGSPITIKSNGQNLYAQSIKINSIGGGSGGSAAAPQKSRPQSGGDTLYRIVIDEKISTVAASGGINNSGYGQTKFRGDKGQSSNFASGGLPGGSQGKNGVGGSLGSGGGGGTGRAPDVFASSTKGGAGGTSGVRVSKTFDISKAENVVLYIDNIGNVSGNLHNPNDGKGGTGEWGDGGSGGKGFIRYSIETTDLVPILYRKEALKRGLTCNVETTLRLAFNTLSGDERKLIQKNLARLNFYNSTIDGLYGKGTETALDTFNAFSFDDPNLDDVLGIFRLLDHVLKTNCTNLDCLKKSVNKQKNVLQTVGDLGNQEVAQEELDKQRLAKLVQKELDKQRLAREKLEKQRLAQEELDKQRLAQEELDKQRLAQEELDKQRIAKEELEKQLRLVQEELKKQRLAQEELEKQRIAKEELEKQRLAQEELEKQRLAQEELEKQRLAQEGLKKQRLEELEKQRLAQLVQEELEKQRIAKEELEKQRLEELERQRLAQKKLEKRLERAKSNPGFRDIRPGLTITEIASGSGCRFRQTKNFVTNCYGIDNIKFGAEFDEEFNPPVLKTLLLDMGPIVQGHGLLDTVNEYIASESPNIYTKYYNLFKEKYSLTHEYNERDRQLFNEDEKSHIYVVFENGQVALRVSKKKVDYSTDLWLSIEYRDVQNGGIFAKKTTPVRASNDDF